MTALQKRRATQEGAKGMRLPFASFRLGHIVATPTALQAISQGDITEGIRRHQGRDWGELSDDDRLANDMALKEGSRLLSAYKSSNGIKFWIITEADRSSTTVLLPSDY